MLLSLYIVKSFSARNKSATEEADGATQSKYVLSAKGGCLRHSHDFPVWDNILLEGTMERHEKLINSATFRDKTINLGSLRISLEDQFPVRSAIVQVPTMKISRSWNHKKVKRGEA